MYKRQALRLAGLEQLLDARQAVRDVLACDAAGVERTHGQLSAGLADGLCSDDADGSADVDRTARGKVPTVALLAHAMLGLSLIHI